LPLALSKTARLSDPEEGQNGCGEGSKAKLGIFTPFTPFSGFSVQALISRWFAVVRMHSRGRIWSLFSIAYQLPKLNVAGSIPVSRSIFSITQEDIL
jgi:hypothetical protein